MSSMADWSCVSRSAASSRSVVNVSGSTTCASTEAISTLRARDGNDYVFERSLLAEDRKRIGLPWLEPVRERGGRQVGSVGNFDVQSDRDECPGSEACLAMDDWRRIAVVDDLLKRDV